MNIRISTCVMTLIQHEADAAFPHEACGLLLGDARLITAATVAANVAAAPERHFEIDPSALFAAIRAQRDGGPAVVGHWHSHPSGDGNPSVTDAAMAAADGALWLICAGGTVTGWRAGHGGLHGRFTPIGIDWV